MIYEKSFFGNKWSTLQQKGGFFVITCEKSFIDHNWKIVNITAKRRFFCDHSRNSFFGHNSKTIDITVERPLFVIICGKLF